MKKSMIGMGALAVTVVLLICAVGTANAGCIGEITGIDYGCGDTVIESCLFTENLNCSTKYGLIIGADGITIDGNGRTITGPAEYVTSEGVHNKGYNNVTVKNLKIKGFRFGIYFMDATNCSIANNTISYDVGSGIWLFGSSDSNITSNEVNYGKDGHGILLSNGANGNWVRDNTLMTINGMGICVHEANENDFYHNIVCENARGDVVVESGVENTGDNNTCDSATNYNDATSARGVCTYSCAACLCPDGTLYGKCSSNKPKYCDAGTSTLIDDCLRCGCPTGYECDNTTGKCYATQKCADGMAYGECSSDKPKYCDNGTGTLIDACLRCGCPSGYTCDIALGSCYATNCGCVADRNPSKIFGCGDTVTESCTFNCDLNCPIGHGLIIGADSITIDGRGYVLNGVEPGTCGGLGVQRSGIYNVGHDNVTIKNLGIENFCNGIYLRGDENIGDIVDNNIVSNCEIHHNGNDAEATATHGIKLKYVSRSTISDNWIHHNRGGGDSCEGGGNGIFLYAGDYNLIFNNTVCDNTKAGIFTKMKPRYNNISYNEVKRNGQGGIILRCKCCNSFSIEHNLAAGNKGPGIYVGGPDNTLRFNTVTDNKNGSIYKNDASVANGIRISREAYNTTLISNDVTGDDERDIYVREGLAAKGYNNTFQTHLNYEDSVSLTGEGIEEVEGKRMVVWEEIIKEVKQGIELPPVKVTPLMATLIVIIALAFILYGYLRKRT